MQYLKDPGEIYRRSFEIIRREASIGTLPEEVQDVAVRLVHACGMTDLVEDLAFSADVVTAARHALQQGAPILVDSRMVASGIMSDRLPANNSITCTLYDPAAAERAAALSTTRSAAAVELWRDQIAGAVIAIGNAPTALFRLLQLLDETPERPAAIFGFPVGLVGAAESKAALAEDPRGVPFLTVRGRRGGSALAAAAVNALVVKSQ